MTITETGAREPQARPLRLLVLDDDPGDYELLLLALGRAGYAPQARRVAGESGLGAALAEETWDVVVVDHVIPGYGGPQGIGLVRREQPDVAIVVVSGQVDEEVIVGDLRLGADDYVFKSGLGRLGPAIEQALLAAHGRRERRRAEEALRAGEARYRHMVEAAGVALLEVDQREGRRAVERIRAAGPASGGSPVGPQQAAEIIGTFSITHCNRWALRLFGVSSAEELRTRLPEFFTPQTLAAASGLLVEIAAGARSSSAEIDLTRPDGRPLICLATVTLPPENDPLSPVLVALSDITQLWQARSEAREARERLEASEARYREMIDRANEGVWSMDAAHLTTFVNRRMAEMLGYEPREMLGRPVEDFMFPEDLPAHRARMAARHEGAPAFYEHRFRRKDGGDLHALVSAVARRDETGAFAGSFAMFTDITRRKQAEAALADSEAMLRAFFEQSLDGIMLADARGVCIAFNPAIERITGLSADEVVGRPVGETMGRIGVSGFDVAGRPDDGVAAQMASAMASGSAPFLEEVTEAVIHDISGRERWISHTCFPITAAAGFMIGCVISDISDRKRAQEVLRASEELLRGLFEATNIGLAVVGADERVQRANPALCRFLGYAEQELVGLSQNDYVHPDDLPRSVREVERLARGDAQSFTLEKRWVRKDGAVVWGLHDCAALRDAAGAYCGRVSAVQDIGEQRAAHEALRAQHDLLATVYRSAPYVIMLLDRDGRVRQINRAGEMLANRAEEQVVGLLCGDVLACPNAAFERGCGGSDECLTCVVRATMEEACSTGRSLSEREGTLTVACDEAEQTLNVIVSAAPVVIEGEELCLVTLADITERRRAEERVRSLAEMVDASAAAIIVHSTDGHLLYANETAPTLHGYSPEEFLKLRLEQLSTAESAALIPSRMERIRGAGQASFETAHVRKDGSTVPLWVDARMVDWEGTEAVLGIAVDQTDQKLTQALLFEQTERLRRTVDGAVLAMGTVVEMRDPYTAGHERRVTRLAEAIGRELELDERRLEALRLAGSVHDIGKIAVPAEILSKPGALHDFEFSLVRCHPGVGADILRSIEFEQPVADIVLQHHERLDGSGYPDGRRGEEMLLEARIIAVADVVEAMASHRPYRPSLGIGAALAEVRDGAGTRYDQAAVDACVRVFDEGFAFDADD